MAISAPIDATKTPAWVALQKHHDELVEKGISLKDWFAADPDRVEKLSYRAGDLYFDLSKNLVTDETLKLLVDLGRACGVADRVCIDCSAAAGHPSGRVGIMRLEDRRMWLADIEEGE